MEKSKLDELICLTAWSTACIDGQKNSSESKATEKEKNIVRAMRAFFKMDADRFNKAYDKYKTYSDHLIELADKDPITKIIARYSALKVAHEDNEDGLNNSNLSDKEWDYIRKIDDLIKIKITYDDIKRTAYDLVYEICALELLADELLIELIEFEKEDGVIFTRSVKPLLQAFFASLEKNNLFDTWEENYLALIKHKFELQDMFGKIDLKEFDDRYKELKPLISNLKKEKIAKDKQLEKEKAELEKNKAHEYSVSNKEKIANEKQLAKEKAELEKNKTHEYSVSNGIHYCRYCGYDKSFSRFDCTRENGHKYSVKRIKKSSYSGDYFEYIPICNKCGQNDRFSMHKCK